LIDPVKGEDDEAPATFACSCLTPRRWKNGESDLSDIMSFEERDAKEDVVADDPIAEGRSASQEEATEEKTEAAKEDLRKALADLHNLEEEVDDATNDSDDVPANEETEDVAKDDIEDKEEDQDVEDEEADQEEEKAAADEEEDEEEELEMAPVSKDKEQAMPSPRKDESLLTLAKTKPRTVKPKPKPKKALVDDIPDDESEASIEVLFRYMGCTNEKYGEHTISATMTMESAYTYGTVDDGTNDLIENIETIETVDDDDDDQVETADTVDDDEENLDTVIEATTDKTTADPTVDGNTDTSEPTVDVKVDSAEATVDFDDGLLRSPSGRLLEDDDEEATADDDTPTDATDNIPVAELGEQAPDAIQQSDSEVQIDNIIKTAGAMVAGLTIDTSSGLSDSPPESENATDSVISRMSTEALSPSVRKIALTLQSSPKYSKTTNLNRAPLSPSARKVSFALQNLPKYPTTDYVSATDGKENSTSEAPSSDNKTEGEQGEKQNPATSLSKVEEMDELIKSTRAWLHTQKTERKIMSNITVETVRPQNEVKKIDTSLPEKKTPLSSAQPLSPRTLDSLLLSRRSGGPKKSVLEALEEVRAKQRERQS
jgi:hypothetical protein